MHIIKKYSYCYKILPFINIFEKNQAALNEKIAEIEAGDMSEDFRAGEVVNECYQFLRYMEHDKALAPKFLADQPEVNAKVQLKNLFFNFNGVGILTFK